MRSKELWLERYNCFVSLEKDEKERNWRGSIALFH